jgi:hypothetical protein
MRPHPETGVAQTITLIESRANGGYVLVPPSPPECHPSGREYVYVGTRDLSQVATITEMERSLLLEVAKEFDELPPPPPRIYSQPRPRVGDHFCVADEFNRRADWHDILEPNGWRFLGADAAGVSHWRRPGKGDGQSATTNFFGNDLLHVFSSSAAPFEPGKTYSKFCAVTLLLFGGDFGRANYELERLGFGPYRLVPGGQCGKK